MQETQTEKSKEVYNNFTSNIARIFKYHLIIHMTLPDSELHKA